MKKLSLFIIVIFALTVVANAQWEQVGEQISLEGNLKEHISMDVNSLDIPYISYARTYSETTSKTWEFEYLVKKFNGTSWVNAGNPTPYVEYAPYARNQIIIDSQDNIYFAYDEGAGYSDKDVTYSTCICKLVDNEWVEIFKEEGFFRKLFIDKDDNLICCYSSIFIKYDGESWTTITEIAKNKTGSERFSLYYQDDQNIWYSYEDGSAGLSLSTKKWNGTTWEYLGNQGYSSDESWRNANIVGKNNKYFISNVGYWGSTTKMYNYDNSWENETITGCGSHVDFTKDGFDNLYYMYSIGYENDKRFALKQYDYDTEQWNDFSVQPPSSYFTAVLTKNDFTYKNGALYFFFNDQNNFNSPFELTVLKYTGIPIALVCPSNPLPENEQTGVSTSTTEITWDAVADATSYDVYFGTTTLEFQETVSTNSFSVTLDENTTYQWQIFSRNQWEVVSGCDVWTFDTGTTGIINNSNNENISIYPNPSNGIFTITNNELQITNVEITDITGKIINNEQLTINNEQFTIDISNQSAGIYFINIQTETGIYTEKIIIN